MRRSLLAVSVAAIVVAAGACANSSTSSDTTRAVATTTAATSPPGGVDPNAPEVVEPGDIPDDQVFVPFISPDDRFSVDVPSGWARTSVADGDISFTDNYNQIDIRERSPGEAPTVDAVRSAGLVDVSGDPTFHLTSVQPVVRGNSDGVMAAYEIASTPNEVTGKSLTLAVERYFFNHDGTTLVLTLSGAQGSDNVDPWRIVTTSVKWA